MSKALFWTLVFGCLLAGGLAEAQSGGSGQTLYQIGNSFTWDSQPFGIQALAGNAGEELEVGHHIRCSSSATGIVNDRAYTCVTPTSFGRFSEALPNNEWDHVAIQSHIDENATLASEINAISSLIDLAQTNPSNSDTAFYLYQAWGFRGGTNGVDYWDTPIPESDSQSILHRRDYFLRLHDGIEAEGHDITLIPAGDVVHRVLTEIEAGSIEGLTDRNDLYRDGLHLTDNVGRFIAGVTVLTTILGRDLTGVEIPEGFYQGGGAVPEALRDRLQSIVWDVVRSHPEAGLIDQLTVGDYNFDSEVNAADLTVWRADFGSTARLSADGNRDYLVSAADYTVLRDSITLSAPQAVESVAVPEPCGFALAVGLACCLCGCRRVADRKSDA